MDIGQIAGILGLASTAVGATGQAVTTVESIKKLLASDKKPDNSEAQTLLNTLATQLTAANMMNVQLSEAIKALSHELKRQDEFDHEKARYELFKTGQNDMVYRLREDHADGQPDHFICPVCLNTERLVSFIAGEGDFKTCQRDKAHVFKFKDTPWPRPKVNRSRFMD